MPVRYSRFVPRYEWSDNSATNQTIVFHDLVLEEGVANTIRERVNVLLPTHGDADAVILRLSDPPSQELVAIAEEVLRGIPAALLYPEGRRMTFRVVGLPLPSTITLNQLRAIEVRGLLEYTHAICVESGYHYALPSGAHADVFLNTNALTRRQSVIRRVADWLGENLTSDTRILVDTSAIMPLALELQARNKMGERVFSFEEYPFTRTAVKALIDEVRTYTDGPLFLITSVNSTGRFIRLAQTTDTDIEVVSIVDSADSLGAAPTLLHYPIRRHEPGEQCSKSNVISIDRATQQRSHQHQWRDVSFRAAAEDLIKRFWRAADQYGAVTLHAQRPYWTKNRHYPVHIDMNRLLDDKWFSETCKKALRAITPRPDLVVIPTHEPAHGRLRGLILDTIAPIAVIEAAETRLPEDAAEALAKAKCVLIADDETITGTTLIGLQRNVHQALAERADTTQIRAFVLLERPNNLDTRRITRNAFMSANEPKPRFWQRRRPQHHLNAAVSLFLPEPSADACPWCREASLLARFANDLRDAAREYVNARTTRLNAATFRAPLAFGTEGVVASSSVLRGSFFGPLRQEAAFAAISSQVIDLQEHELADRDNTYRVFRTSSGMSFFDGIITAAIFRTLHVRDLIWSGQYRDTVQGLAALGETAATSGVIGELALAALDGKLPSPLIRPLLDRLEGAGGEAIRSLFDIDEI
jgi:hypothetical protein